LWSKATHLFCIKLRLQTFPMDIRHDRLPPRLELRLNMGILCSTKPVTLSMVSIHPLTLIHMTVDCKIHSCGRLIRLMDTAKHTHLPTQPHLILIMVQ
ncbi:hypothetical protein BGZ96_003344, partial [Linnemannia gamsii]